MKPRWIAVLIVAVLIGFLVYTVYAKDTVEVEAGDYGTVKSEITVHYSDGTTKTITKVKTADFAAASVKHNGTTIKKFTIAVAYQPNKGLGENVRVLCDSADAEHMSTLTVKAKCQASTADISTHPLSLTEKSNFITIETGDYKTIWGEVTVTANELENAKGLWGIGTNWLTFEVKIWLNIDKDSNKVEGFQVDFGVPFTVLKFAVYVPTKDTTPPDGGVHADPITDSSKAALKDWVVNYNVKMDQTVQTKFTSLASSSSSTASWKLTGNSGQGSGFGF